MKAKGPGARDAEARNVFDQNAPGNNSPDTAEQRPLDLIDLNAPWAGQEERGLRRQIHRAGAVATAKAMRERNGRARELYWVASEVARTWTFRRVDDLARLERIIRGLCQVYMAADNFKQEEGPDDAAA